MKGMWGYEVWEYSGYEALYEVLVVEVGAEMVHTLLIRLSHIVGFDVESNSSLQNRWFMPSSLFF